MPVRTRIVLGVGRPAIPGVTREQTPGKFIQGDGFVLSANYLFLMKRTMIYRYAFW